MDNYEIDYSFHQNVINRFANVPIDEWNYLTTLLHVDFRKKGEHLVKEGQVCRELFYIIKGGARFYYINDQGKEISYNFIFENNFVVAYNSLFNQLPTSENIVLLEDTLMFILYYNDFRKLLSRHKVWETLLNKLLAKHFLKMGEKEKMLLLDDHEARYEKLFKNRPYLFQRVEQKHIASYLGMTPETLSRIKKKTYTR